MNELKAVKKYPESLLICSIIEFLERYGFSIVQALVALLVIHVFTFSHKASFALTGTLLGLVYTTSLIGGYIADKWLGYLKAIILGETVLVFGFFLLGLSILDINPNHLYFALALTSVGVGLVKTNTSALLGCFYHKKDPLRDFGFSIFYIFINIGTVIGGFLAGYLVKAIGWESTFFTGAYGCVMALLVIFYARKKLKKINSGLEQFSLDKLIKALLVITGSIFLCYYAFYSNQLSNLLFVIIGFFSIIILFYIAKSNPKYLRSCLIFAVLISVSVVYWGLFFQIFSSFMVLINLMVNTNVFGFKLPTSSFFAIESLAVILMGPMVGRFWYIMAKRKKPVQDIGKFSIAILLVAIVYFLLFIALSLLKAGVLISGYFVIFLFVLLAVSELALSPIGLSAANKICPPNQRGLFVGIWLISLGLGGKLSGVFAYLLAIPAHATIEITTYIYKRGALELTVIALATFVFSVISNRFLKSNEIEVN